MTIFWAKLVPELTVSDYMRSLEFYTLIGFELLFSRENFGYLELDGAQLMIEQYDATGWNTAELVYPFGRGMNLQIETYNATALRDKLVAAGYTLYQDIKETWYQTGAVKSGVLEFLIQDPDGYLLRFAESLDEA